MKKFQSGRYVQQGHYKSVQPTFINRGWALDNMGLIQMLGQADRELGRLDMYSDYIPNLDALAKSIQTGNHLKCTFEYLGPKRLALLESSWAHLFREEILHKLPVEKLFPNYDEFRGRRTKELYNMLGLTILQQMEDLTG